MQALLSILDSPLNKAGVVKVRSELMTGPQSGQYASTVAGHQRGLGRVGDAMRVICIGKSATRGP